MSSVQLLHAFITRIKVEAIAAFVATLALAGEGALVAQDAVVPPHPAPQDNPLISRIAFGSCATQDEPQLILRTVLEWKRSIARRDAKERHCGCRTKLEMGDAGKETCSEKRSASRRKESRRRTSEARRT